MKFMARRPFYHNRKNSNVRTFYDAKDRFQFRYQLVALSLCGAFILFCIFGIATYRRHSLLTSSPQLDYKNIPISGVFGTGPPSHLYREDGLLEVNSNGTHPILELIDRAEGAWASKHTTASRTLDEAIMEYERRYNRLPPVGFDNWWNYVAEHDVKLPDEYDSIYHDLEPFWGIDPEDLQTIRDNWYNKDYLHTVIFGKENGQPLQIFNNSMVEQKIEAHTRSVVERLKLLEPVDSYLPDFKAVISPMDNPSAAVIWEHKTMLLEAAQAGTYVNIEELSRLPPSSHDWPAACSPDSPARQGSIDLSNPYQDFSINNTKTFIYDHRKSMDPCQHPTHFLQSGEFLIYKHWPPLKRLPIPQFSSCSTPVHYDLLPIPPGSSSEYRKPLSWPEKSSETLLWRGRNTGIYSSPKTYWKQAQRMRLVNKTADTDGTIDILRSPDLSEDYKAVGSPERWHADLVNSAMMDIKFVDSPIQCEEETCKEMEEMFDWAPIMTESEALEYKYVMDVDGNGWSSRFRRLLSSNSVIFKSTVYPEWYTDRIQPWVHYVPISIDYSDLYDALVFFRGNLDGQGQHDVLARRIAEAARHWTQTYARREDMTAYMFRLFLEYARVMSPDREAMTMDQRRGRSIRHGQARYKM